MSPSVRSKRRALIASGVGAVAVAVAAALVIALSGGGGASTNSDLQAALSYLPANFSRYQLSFVDWAAIERSVGVTLAPNASNRQLISLEDRVIKLAPVSGEFDVLGAGAVVNIADLVWEADLTGAGPPLHVARVVLGYDFAAAGRVLERCGFHPSRRSGLTVYSGSPLAPPACVNLMPTTSYFAIDEHNHVILSSISLDPVLAADRAARLSRAAQLSSVLQPLASDPVVVEDTDPALCSKLAIRNARPQAAAKPVGSAYDGFAFGLRYGRATASGQIVMNYGDAQAAQRDLAGRERALRTGLSAYAQLPFSQLLHLDGGRVDASRLILDVSRPSGRRLVLYDMWTRGDLAFAGC